MANNKKGKNWGAFWTGLIIFIIVVALLVSIMGWRTQGFNDWTFGFGQVQTAPDNSDNSDNSDGKHDDTDGKGDDSEDKGTVSGGGTVSDVTSGKGIKLVNSLIPVEQYSDYGIERTAVSAYTVTAIIEPEETTEKDLVWSVAWGSKYGYWGSEAQGAVTDYVTLTPNGLSATVALKKAFGTQIILTVASKNYRDVSATATFDYVQRGEFSDISASHSLAISLNITDSGATTSYTLMPNFGIGSVQGTFEIKSASIQFTSAVWYDHDSNFTNANSAYGKQFSGGAITFNSSAINVTSLKNNDMKGTFVFDYKSFFKTTGAGGGIASCSSCQPYLKSYLIATSKYSSVSDWGTVTFTGSYSYGDYSSDFTFKVGVNRWVTSSIVVAPSGVGVDNGSFYF